MKITDFANFIREIPHDQQSFDIKRSVWKTEVSQKSIIDGIFDGNETITISRFDLFQSASNLQEFVIKVLMWGYPTKGRGKNIENLLQPKNFDLLVMKLKMIEETNNLTTNDILYFLAIKGLGMSTLTKLLYFKRVTIDSNLALILDQRVINALNSGRYSDFGIEKFLDMKNNNSVIKYMDYLHFTHNLADQMNVAPDRLELFLFEFGSNLKEL